MATEQERLAEARVRGVTWKKWGPYLSERQWGTVREDYSDNGDAWNYFTHDQARSRAYRWGEDGLAGFSDDKQRLCFALALWNGRDPILKERLFGLTNSEGNHGEDVKEYYFYLDSTPTHSYMKYLYKYPQRGVPLRRPGGDEPRGAAATSSSTSCSTRASSRATATSTCSSSTPRPGRRTCWCRSPRPIAGRRRRSFTCCRPCGSATTGRRGYPSRPRSRCSSRSTDRRARARVAAAHAGLGEYYLYCRGRCAPALHRERDEQRAALSRASEREPVREGRHRQLRRPRGSGRRESGTARHQGRRALPGDGRRRPVGDDTVAPHRPGPRQGLAPSGRSSRTPWPPGCGRPTSSIAP